MFYEKRGYIPLFSVFCLHWLKRSLDLTFSQNCPYPANFVEHQNKTSATRMNPHFFCSNYAYKMALCSRTKQNKPLNLSFLKTVGDAKPIPRMRGTLIKSLVHAMRAPSRASKNNWFQFNGRKKARQGEPCRARVYNIICCMSSRRLLLQGHTWRCSLLYHPCLV